MEIIDKLCEYGVPYCGCLVTVIAIIVIWLTAGTVQYGFVVALCLP
jgi:hypothetical protein